MPSGSNPFDATPRPTRPTSATSTPRTAPSAASPDTTSPRSTNESRSPRERDPNYQFRRAVVVGGILAVVVAAALIVPQLMGSGSDDTPLGAVSADWNRVVLLDATSGEVSVVGSDGTEVARFDSGVSAPVASDVIDSSMLVASAEAVAVLDLTPMEGESATASFDFGADAIVTPAGSSLTMIAASTDRRRAALVHGPSGDTIDTNSFAAIAGARYEFSDARTSPSGRNVLVTDSGNFQSVLFSFDRDQPSFFPGLALALDDTVVVTAQNVGNNATISIFDHAGVLLSTGQMPSVRAGMVAGEQVVLVTVDGTVITMEISSGNTEARAELEIGTIEAGNVVTTGNRIVLGGSSGTAVVDDSAGVLGTYDNTRLADEGVAPVGSQCVALLPIGDESSPPLSFVDFSSGDSQREGPASPPRFSDASGCTVAAATPSSFDILGEQGGSEREAVARADSGDVLVALAPDGSVVAVERDGRLRLLGPFPGRPSPESPIDLGPIGRVIHFTEL